MATRDPPITLPVTAYTSPQLPDGQAGSADITFGVSKIYRHKEEITRLLTFETNLMFYLKNVPNVVKSFKALCVHAALTNSRFNPSGDNSTPRRIASFFMDLMTTQDEDLPNCKDDLGDRFNDTDTEAVKESHYKDWLSSCWRDAGTDLPTDIVLAQAPYPPGAGELDTVSAESRDLITAFHDHITNWDATDLVVLMEDFYNVVESRTRNKLSHKLLKDLVFGTIAVAKAGEITFPKFDKIRQTMDAEHGLDIDIDHDQIKKVWRLINLTLKNSRIQPAVIMRRLSALFPVEHFLRVHLTIRQSIGVGSSVVTMINDAIKITANHPIWGYLVQTYPVEWDKAVSGLRALALNAYAALGSESEITKSTNFPNVGYAAYKILMESGHGSTLSRYRGRWNSHNQFEIDNIIEKQKIAASDAITAAAVAKMPIVDWSTVLPDLNVVQTLATSGTLVATNSL